MTRIYIFDMDLNKVKLVIWGELGQKIQQMDLNQNSFFGFKHLVIKEY